MNVEYIQKINQLAVELIQQGIANSKDEAIRRAEEMLTKDGSMPISEIDKPQQRTEPTSEQKSEFEGIMQKNTDFLVKTIREFQTQLDAIREELGKVKGRVDSLAQKTEQMKFQQPARAEATTENPTAQSQQKVKPAESGHPRTGSHTQEEVSIEKMFYFGNK